MTFIILANPPKPWRRSRSMPRPKHADRQVQEKIAACVRAARVQKGWTQEQLAEALDVATETVSRYEVGRAPPSLPMLYRIAEALGVEVTSLLGQGATKMTVAEAQLLKGWRRLAPKEQSTVLQLVEHLSSRPGGKPAARSKTRQGASSPGHPR